MGLQKITLEEIRGGLERNEFFLEYMPVVSLGDGRCVGAEALIRWRRATGVLQPNDFIPLVEGTRLSGPLTYWVLDRVALELTDWLRENRNAFVAVNVPPEILGRGGMEYAARNSGLSALAPQVVLEITERGVPDGIGLQALEAMWGARIRVALDDVKFAGGPNLAILSRSHFSMLKLDLSLVAQIGPGRPFPVWLAGLKAMLRSSPLEVIAEGVETKIQAEALRDAGVRSAQGFLFSKSLSVGEFFEFFRQRGRSPSHGA